MFRIILICLLMSFLFTSCDIQESDLCINFNGADGASTTGLPPTTVFFHSGTQSTTVSVRLGNWLLYENRRIANALGYRDADSLQIYEPTNVLWIDFQSRTASQAAEKIDAFLKRSGFKLEGCPLHTARYSVIYDDNHYVDQTPRNATWADREWPNPNNHGRVFPTHRQTVGDQTIYYTLGAFSREKSAGDLHEFLSFDIARDVLKISGGWQDNGIFPLDNVFPPDQSHDFSTKDHSGTRVFELR